MGYAKSEWQWAAGFAPAPLPLASLDRDLYSECVRLLVAARRAAGLTQQQLAERIGQRQTFVSKVELEERRLDVAEFIRLSRAVEADPGELIRAAQRALGLDCPFAEAGNVRLPAAR